MSRSMPRTWYLTALLPRGEGFGDPFVEKKPAKQTRQGWQCVRIRAAVETSQKTIEGLERCVLDRNDGIEVGFFHVAAKHAVEDHTMARENNSVRRKRSWFQLGAHLVRVFPGGQTILRTSNVTFFPGKSKSNVGGCRYVDGI